MQNQSCKFVGSTKTFCAYPLGSLFTLLFDLFNHEKQDALSTFRSEAICQSNVNQTKSSVTLVSLNGQAMKCTYFLNNEKNSYMCSIYTCWLQSLRHIAGVEISPWQYIVII